MIDFLVVEIMLVVFLVIEFEVVFVVIFDDEVKVLEVRVVFV